VPGVNRKTFEVIDNLSSTLQSVEVILSTRIGSRVMRREFGGGAVELLGRAVTPKLFNAFRQLVATSIDEYEPRLLVRQIWLKGSIENLRLGTGQFVVEADYRPRGHKGDFSVARLLTFGLGFNSGAVTASKL